MWPKIYIIQSKKKKLNFAVKQKKATYVVLHRIVYYEGMNRKQCPITCSDLTAFLFEVI